MKKQTVYLILNIVLCSITFCSCVESNQESEKIITTKNAKLIYSVDEYGNKEFSDTAYSV